MNLSILDGMTLRDYFAAKAMASLYQATWIDNATQKAITIQAKKTGRNEAQEIAAVAYDMADCMLAERAQ